MVSVVRTHAEERTSTNAQSANGNAWAIRIERRFRDDETTSFIVTPKRAQTFGLWGLDLRLREFRAKQTDYFFGFTTRR